MLQADINERCIEYLINEKTKLHACVFDLTEQYLVLIEEEDRVLHRDITSEYTERVRSTLLIWLCKDLFIQPDQALIFLETLNVMEYLK